MKAVRKITCSYYFAADKDFMKTYDISLAQGRNFDTRS